MKLKSTLAASTFGLLAILSIRIAQPQVTRAIAQAPQMSGGSSCQVAVKGQTQGQLKGPIQGKWIPCSQFLFQVVSPRDPASGLPTGRRQHSPITITKEWDAASPLLLQALTSNENLPLVEFQFWKAGAQGGEQLVESIKLTNATITSFKQYIGFPDAGEQPSPRQLEDVAFVFQKIEVTYPSGNITATDDWNAVR